MTRFMLAACLVPVLTAGTVRAQDRPPAELDGVIEALLEGRARAILDHAADRIEVGLLAATRTYTKSQARFVLDRFFEDHPPEDVRVDRSTGTRQGWYVAASYRHVRSVEAADLYLRFRLHDGVWELRELVIREGT